MIIFAWNSQGAKWADFWDYWLTPAAIGQETVLGLVVEAGWAPWITSDSVTLNAAYPLDSTSTRFNSHCADQRDQDMVDALSDSRRNRAAWIPWVRNLDAMKTNTRCSIGAFVMPVNEQLIGAPETVNLEALERPVLKVELSRGKATILTVLLVHAISSSKAKLELKGLIAVVDQLVPTGSPTIIVGDMNLALAPKLPPGKQPDLPPGWLCLRCGHATQKSGNELDYALLHDPHNLYWGATGQDVATYKTGLNRSDHSVMRYDLTART